MKLYNYLTPLVVATTLVACSQTSHTGQYTINGTAAGVEDGTVVTLRDRADHVLAETTIQDGQFSITGTTDSLMSVVLSTGQRSVGSSAYIEAGEINVDLIAHTATGTPLNDEAAALSQVVDAAMQTEGVDVDSLIHELCYGMYENHPNDPLGLMAFENAAYSMTYDEVKSALEKAGPVISESPRVAKILSAKAKLKVTAVGTRFNDIEGTDVNNTDATLRLSDFAGRGKPTLVDFWASWCGPCRQETPIVAAAARKYGDRINVVGIAVWDKIPDTQQAIKELGITWPVIFNERQATDAYGIQGIPHILLIDGDGTIVARELRGPAIEAAIEAELSK